MTNNKRKIKIQPLGGLGQIGANCCLLETESTKIIIDAGILFPSEDLFDLQYVIPDISSITGVDHLIITHAHEDHLGGIHHIINQFPAIKVWAPPLARALIQKKLQSSHNPHPITCYESNIPLLIDTLEIIPILTPHSILQNHALLISDIEKSFSILYASDFKFSDTLANLPVSSKLRILMSDSTNVSHPGSTPKEADLIPALESIIKERTWKRLFFTFFSSNLERMQNIINLTADAKKHLVPLGQSMLMFLKIGEELGLLHIPENVIKNPDSVSADQENIIFIVSGCQGDFRSTLRRIALNEDKHIKPRQGDLFVYSARIIPGNEKKVNSIFNQLYKSGAQVITWKDKVIHASGHAYQDDLKQLYQTFRPHHAIPIHGEVRFLHAHIDFIQRCFPQTIPHLLYNFDSLDLFSDNSVGFVAGEEPEHIFIHGNFLPIERQALSERRKVAAAGAVYISIRLDSMKNRRPNWNATFLGLPFLLEKHREHFDNFITTLLQNTKIVDKDKSQEELRIAIRQYFNNILGYKPVTVIHLI